MVVWAADGYSAIRVGSGRKVGAEIAPGQMSRGGGLTGAGWAPRSMQGQQCTTTRLVLGAGRFRKLLGLNKV
jgi:hypothetical protein